MAGKNKTPPFSPASSSDEALKDWQSFAAATQPLSRRKAEPLLPPHPEKPPEKPMRLKHRPPPALSESRELTQGDPEQLRAVDPRELKKIKSGKRLIEAALDLHGMNQKEAYGALIRFIRRAHQSEKRTLQIITGKSEHKSGGGVLRRRVPEWLAGSPELRPLISGFSSEPARAGGHSGAYIVTLRRQG